MTFKNYLSVFLGHILVFDVKMTSQMGSRYKPLSCYTTIGFPVLKILSMWILRPKPSFFRFSGVLDEYRTIWRHFGVCDVKKGVKILKSYISDIINSFSTLKNLPMYIFRSNQSFYHALLCLNIFPL